ncbi:hypothetical protein CPB83DRAFT_869524 [Crepidotus variabilis]|uniref:FAD/NAD(P)-binding domain-containing protein n=1 Tax=Crepidotus variabilis TaxID=179855 RepID=A0A9P6JPM9_9AGAR|nr:hypothetical protein CPB83DRAFT_869524 [Crepidotus variabilis]
MFNFFLTSLQDCEIGIIGAGPGGLAALKAVLDSPQFREGSWKVTAFEAREDVGGIWLPAGGNGQADELPPTPLYDSLTTNLPHPIMAFTNYHFPPSTPLFPKAEVIQEYLRSYASEFNLLPHIHLNTRVTKVNWDGRSEKWALETSQGTSHSLDLILICNGHHNVPRYPRIPGLQRWVSSGRAAHSIRYRRPSSAPFPLNSAHTVLVVGGGPSGQDIVADIANVVKKVVHSASNLRRGDEFEENVIRRGRTVKFLDDFQGVEFEGGIIETGIDFVLLATGYEVKFPFLPTSTQSDAPGGVYLREGIPLTVPPLPNETWNTSFGVFPLARHMFPFTPLIKRMDGHTTPSPPATSIFFFGLLVRVIPMPLIEVQARAALAAFVNPEKVDWTGEAVDVVARYEELKARLNVDVRVENGRIHQGWFRLEPQEQFDYRDALVDYIKLLENPDSDSIRGEGEKDPERVRRVHDWEREIYSKKDLVRRTWRVLEASGKAEEWVRGVGEGNSGRTAEEEWIELMFKVVEKGEEDGDREHEEQKCRL